MEEVFRVYTKGSGEMDGRTFVKLLQDTKVVDKSFTRADADIIFAKVKDKGAKKISFSAFDEAVKLIAERKKISQEEMYNLLSTGKEGPILTGTLPDAVRFHDDKSTYTGVHKAGGPTTVDTGRVQFSSLAEICDRTAYNIRGVKEGVMERKTGDSK